MIIYINMAVALRLWGGYLNFSNFEFEFDNCVAGSSGDDEIVITNGIVNDNSENMMLTVE